LKTKADWAEKDFGKPNIERFGAQSRTWLPVLTDCRHAGDTNGHTILAQLKIDDGEAEKSGRVAWPKKNVPGSDAAGCRTRRRDSLFLVSEGGEPHA
jgi:hypothetical protein